MLKRPQSPADLPASVPVFPLSGALLLPYSRRPLNIFEPRYIEMVDHALKGDRKGEFAMTVTKNWRLVFAKIDDQTVADLDLEDYH